MKVVLALDLGTTGNRVIAFSKDGREVAKAHHEFSQIFPKPGWVEHDPEEIWVTLKKVLDQVISKVGKQNVDSIGITNQRETTVLWDKKTGKPVYNAIVWQCRRTSSYCKELKAHELIFRDRTGLSLDPYFSGTKIKWILDNIKSASDSLKKGNLLFGTIDSWILWKLTNGKVHLTDPSNASRTLCFNIHQCDYDRELLEILKLPFEIFPEIRDSSSFFGQTDEALFGIKIPITGILGDQQASLFAQAGFIPGKIKNTYGTGLFVMLSTGSEIFKSEKLVSTIAWKIDGKASYALEGSIFVGGGAISWLRDGLKVISKASDSETLALSLDSNEGVYFVPALTGLGAPYWNYDARGMIVGLTRGTTSAHLARAALEAICYQTKDVIEEMNHTVDISGKVLGVDGGAAKNNFLMQFQSDILNIPIERPKILEITALGAAGIAGLYTNFWNKQEFIEARSIDKIFYPKMNPEDAKRFYSEWRCVISTLLFS